MAASMAAAAVSRRCSGWRRRGRSSRLRGSTRRARVCSSLLDGGRGGTRSSRGHCLFASCHCGRPATRTRSRARAGGGRGGGATGGGDGSREPRLSAAQSEAAVGELGGPKLQNAQRKTGDGEQGVVPRAAMPTKELRRAPPLTAHGQAAKARRYCPGHKKHLGGGRVKKRAGARDVAGTSTGVTVFIEWRESPTGAQKKRGNAHIFVMLGCTRPAPRLKRLL